MLLSSSISPSNWKSWRLTCVSIRHASGGVKHGAPT
jgi:hypothetical protein